jgi:hypothetical protein
MSLSYADIVKQGILYREFEATNLALNQVCIPDTPVKKVTRKTKNNDRHDCAGCGITFVCAGGYKDFCACEQLIHGVCSSPDEHFGSNIRFYHSIECMEDVLESEASLTEDDEYYDIR